MEIGTTAGADKPLALHESLLPAAARRSKPSSIRTLDARQLAETLHITVQTVWNCLGTAEWRKRLPPPVRIAGASGAIWREETVAAWLLEREVKPGALRGRPTKRLAIEKATRAAGCEA